LAQQLCQLAQGAMPEECCGLLVGVREGGPAPSWSLQALYPMRNLWTGQAEGQRTFAIAPQDLIDCYRSLRARGAEVIGHYHSHPNGRIGPSPRDCASITDPDALWIIAAVNGPGVDLSAWVPCAEDAFAPVALTSV
jgi:proteasome lid subunit RPN8/RPN11